MVTALVELPDYSGKLHSALLLLVGGAVDWRTTFWGDGNILFLVLGGDYMGVCSHQNTGLNT